MFLPTWEVLPAVCPWADAATRSSAGSQVFRLLWDHTTPAWVPCRQVAGCETQSHKAYLHRTSLPLHLRGPAPLSAFSGQPDLRYRLVSPLRPACCPVFTAFCLYQYHSWFTPGLGPVTASAWALPNPLDLSLKVISSRVHYSWQKPCGSHIF